MSPVFEHFALRDWPYRIVPDGSTSRIWAGRQSQKKHVETWLMRWQRYDRTALHILWADFGAGKTHTLQYLKARCEDSRAPVLCFYSALPKTLKSFADLYRQVAESIYFSDLKPTIIRAWQTVGQQQMRDRVAAGNQDCYRALQALASPDSQRGSTAEAWFRSAGSVSKRDLTAIGISGPIKTTDQAVAAWSTLAKLFAASGRYRRVVCLLDEYQRTSSCRPAVLADLNAGLHTVFNTCSTGMTFVIAFSLGKPDNIRFLLSPELRSRAEIRDNLQLPVFSPPEAADFIAELNDAFRLPGADVESGYPFQRKAIEEVVRFVAGQGKLLPRPVIMCCEAVLFEADRIYQDTGKVPQIDAAFAAQVLCTDQTSFWSDASEE